MEENVYEETTLTEEKLEQTIEGVGRENADKNDSTVLGKFKDVNALARAYEALQAEFTRRSQRLKILEKQAENSDGSSLTRLGAEKLRKNAKARKEEAKHFEEFLASTKEFDMEKSGQKIQSEPENQPLENLSEKESAGAVKETAIANDTFTQEPVTAEGTSDEAKNVLPIADGEKPNEPTAGLGAEKAEGGALADAVKSGNATASSSTLYEQVCRDESVRLRIIGEYLTSLGKSAVPLMTGGVGAMKTPPKKATSVSDAGNMALLYFQKAGAEL